MKMIKSDVMYAIDAYINDLTTLDVIKDDLDYQTKRLVYQAYKDLMEELRKAFTKLKI